MKGVPILIAVALLVASTSYAQQQQPQQNGQLPNGAPPSDSPIEPRPRDVPPGGRASTPAQNVVAVPVPVAPPRPNGPIQKSLVRITATEVAPEIARLQGMALAGVFQIIISEAGQRTREGQSQLQIANELRPIIENVLDELDRWLSVQGPSALP